VDEITEQWIEEYNAIRVIAMSLDYPCAKRLRPNLVWMAKHLTRHQEISISPISLALLEKISVSTVRRLLKRVRQGENRLAYSRKPRAPSRAIVQGNALISNHLLRYSLNTLLN
jgi:hypothetical protein